VALALCEAWHWVQFSVQLQYPQLLYQSSLLICLHHVLQQKSVRRVWQSKLVLLYLQVRTSLSYWKYNKYIINLNWMPFSFKLFGITPWIFTTYNGASLLSTYCKYIICRWPCFFPWQKWYLSNLKSQTLCYHLWMEVSLMQYISLCWLDQRSDVAYM